jgi:hypothetical protein
MQASGQSDLKEREERLEVFPGLDEVRLRRLEVRERLASRRPRRRARAALRALLFPTALGLIALAAWRTSPLSGGAAGDSMAEEHRSGMIAPPHSPDPSPLVETGPAPFTVVMAGDTPSVELAPALRRAIRRECPGYRLRPAAAIETEALEELRLEHPEVRSPYAVSGDFNGDGRIDAALLLKRGSRALLVAFHAAPDGRYRSRVLQRGRWADGLYLLPQAPGPVEYTAAQDESRATAATLTLPGPAVRFHPVDAGARVYFWDDGEYRAIEVGT